MADDAQTLASVAGEARGLDLMVGTQVDGRYRVGALIGGGGMGSIYCVEHVELRRRFAMKVLKTELSGDRGMVERFRREARRAASISSEHVVGMVDAGVLADGRPYFVMDLLLGADLRRLLSLSGALGPARTANLGIDVCRGLAAAHAVGLIHRDLKPENLFVTRGDDGRDICKILDFGVAKGQDSGATRPGALIGTVRYMAPEQLGVGVPVGPSTDLRALGVILYECLSGVVPFEGDTTERVLYQIMHGKPRPIAERCPLLPRNFANVVERALAHDPAERYPSAQALAEALLPFSGGRQASAGEASWMVGVASDLGAPNALSELTPVVHEPSSAPRAQAQPRASVHALRGPITGALAGAASVGMIWWSANATRSERPAPISKSTAPQSAPASVTRQAPQVAETIAEPAPPATETPPLASGVVSLKNRAAKPRASSGRPPPRLPRPTSFDAENPYAQEP